MNFIINTLKGFILVLFAGCGGVNTVLTVNLEKYWGELISIDDTVYGVPVGDVVNDGFYYRVEPLTITSLPVLSYDSKVEGGSKVLAVVFPENVICGANLEEIPHDNFKIRDSLKLCKILYSEVGMTYYDMLGYRDSIIPEVLDDNQTMDILSLF